MKVIENTTYNFKTITPSKGKVLTTWKESDGIEKYSSATEMCTPMNFDEKILRELTVAQDEKYKKEQYELFMAKERERMK